MTPVQRRRQMQLLTGSAALAELTSVVQANGMDAEGDMIMSPTDFVQLNGEVEVLGVMRDADIVRMVSTQGTDEAESDEDAADDFQPCTITAQALEYARALSEFAMSRPEQFGGGGR
jgi:hypothetical protein